VDLENVVDISMENEMVNTRGLITRRGVTREKLLGRLFQILRHQLDRELDSTDVCHLKKSVSHARKKSTELKKNSMRKNFLTSCEHHRKRNLLTVLGRETITVIRVTAVAGVIDTSKKTLVMAMVLGMVEASCLRPCVATTPLLMQSIRATHRLVNWGNLPAGTWIQKAITIPRSSTSQLSLCSVLSWQLSLLIKVKKYFMPMEATCRCAHPRIRCNGTVVTSA
jgi:hypothetical protein